MIFSDSNTVQFKLIALYEVTSITSYGSSSATILKPFSFQLLFFRYHIKNGRVNVLFYAQEKSSPNILKILLKKDFDV